MNPLNRFIAVVTSVAHLLAACSASPPSQMQPDEPKVANIAAQAPEKEDNETLPAAGLNASNLMTGWPEDTPGLRDVVFKFSVSGDRKSILSDDGNGFLVIQNQQTSQLAQLVFLDKQRATYRLPVGGFRIVSVGASLTCRDTSFTVPPIGEAHQEFDLEIEGGSFSVPESRWAYLKLEERRGEKEPREASSLNKFCRNDFAWLEFDKIRTKGPHIKKYARTPSDGSVAKGVLGFIVLLPLCLLFTPSGSTCELTR